MSAREQVAQIEQARDRARERAREEYAEGSSDNIEIDEDAKVNEAGDDGFWVAAWVYVRGEE